MELVGTDVEERMDRTREDRKLSNFKEKVKTEDTLLFSGGGVGYVCIFLFLTACGQTMPGKSPLLTSLLLNTVNFQYAFPLCNDY